MHNKNELQEISDYKEIVSGLPELQIKLEAIQKFLRRVMKGKSPEKNMEMLLMLGFSVDGDILEYNFGKFSVRFPIEKGVNDLKSLTGSKSFILQRLADNLSGEESVEMD